MNDVISSNKYNVCVLCWTYNHAKFIEQALNGICSQETSFPFVCVVVDDNSTDGEPDIISNYLKNNFELSDATTIKEETDNYKSILARHRYNVNCYIAVLLLKYNHHGKKSKSPYVARWQNEAKYIAYCEGDDYWTDSQKLQMQVDFLDEHPEYSMVCNKTAKYSQKHRKIIGTDFDHSSDIDLSVKNIIIHGGLYISTCSILYRKEARFLSGIYPSYCVNCHVGDYPLQIMLAMNGKVRCFSNCMSVYRVDNPESWMGRTNALNHLTEKRMRGILSEIRMLKGFSQDFPQYSSLFHERIRYFIKINMPYKKEDPRGYKMYLTELKQDMKAFSPKDRLLLKIEHNGGLPEFAYQQYRKIKQLLS